MPVQGRSRLRPDAGDGAADSSPVHAAHRRVSRTLAHRRSNRRRRNSSAADQMARKSNRSTARPTCRGSSRFGIGLPGDNSVDLYSHDLGLLAICENWKIVGYNVLVGGGFGVTPSAKKTFPAIAQPMCFVTPAAGDRRVHGDRQGAARLRQSGRPQGRPDEVPDPRLGPRPLQAEGRRILRRLAAGTTNRRRSTASTTAWAGTPRATASCSTA